MPTTISFAGSSPSLTPNPAQKASPRTVAAAPPMTAKDSVHFSGTGTATPEPEVEAPTPPQPPTVEAKSGNWFTNRCRTILPAVGTAFHGGKWMSLPFKGWRADLLQATVITLPLTILPGSQLILIPTWMAIGAFARTALALGKGMWGPEKFLQETADKKAAQEAAKH